MELKYFLQFFSLNFRVDLTSVWGHMNLFAHGAGQAVAQLDLTYGVDYEPGRVSNYGTYMYVPYT